MTETLEILEKENVKRGKIPKLLDDSKSCESNDSYKSVITLSDVNNCIREKDCLGIMMSIETDSFFENGKTHLTKMGKHYMFVSKYTGGRMPFEYFKLMTFSEYKKLIIEDKKKNINQLLGANTDTNQLNFFFPIYINKKHWTIARTYITESLYLFMKKKYHRSYLNIFFFILHVYKEDLNEIIKKKEKPNDIILENYRQIYKTCMRIFLEKGMHQSGYYDDEEERLTYPSKFDEYVYEAKIMLKKNIVDNKSKN